MFAPDVVPPIGERSSERLLARVVLGVPIDGNPVPMQREQQDFWLFSERLLNNSGLRGLEWGSLRVAGVTGLWQTITIGRTIPGWCGVPLEDGIEAHDSLSAIGGDIGFDLGCNQQSVFGMVHPVDLLQPGAGCR